MSSPKVLDAWILMAWLKDQPPAADTMEGLWQAASRGDCRLIVNVVNLGEVYYLTAKAKDVETAETVLEEILSFPLEVWSVPDSLVFEAARLKARFPISYADAFAAATARQAAAPLVTGDSDLRRLEANGVLQVEWVA